MDPTATCPIGRTDVTVTRFGLGGGPFGMDPAPAADRNAWEALEAAWREGVRYFDTAPWYGRGLSEHRVGRFLRSRTGEPYVLSTKVGRVLTPSPGARSGSGGLKGGPREFAVQYDYTRSGILRSHADSLQRLGVTSVDLAVVHDLDLGYLPPQARMDAHTDQLLTSGWSALQDLRAEGVVGAIGFGINDFGLVSRWLDLFDPDFFLVAGPYTLMEQGGLEELTRCVERGVSVITGMALGSGLLATHSQPGARYWYREASDGEIDRARRLEETCQRFDVPVVAAALQFPLGHPAVAAVIPGAKAAAEVDANLQAIRQTIPPELWDCLKSEGLLRADAPTP